MTAQQVLDALITSDEGRDVRQLAILDSKGNVAVYTGKTASLPLDTLWEIIILFRQI